MAKISGDKRTIFDAFNSLGQNVNDWLMSLDENDVQSYGVGLPDLVKEYVTKSRSAYASFSTWHISKYYVGLRSRLGMIKFKNTKKKHSALVMEQNGEGQVMQAFSGCCYRITEWFSAFDPAVNSYEVKVAPAFTLSRGKIIRIDDWEAVVTHVPDTIQDVLIARKFTNIDDVEVVQFGVVCTLFPSSKDMYDFRVAEMRVYQYSHFMDLTITKGCFDGLLPLNSSLKKRQQYLEIVAWLHRDMSNVAWKMKAMFEGDLSSADLEKCWNGGMVPLSTVNIGSNYYFYSYLPDKALIVPPQISFLDARLARNATDIYVFSKGMVDFNFLDIKWSFATNGIRGYDGLPRKAAGKITRFGLGYDTVRLYAKNVKASDNENDQRYHNNETVASCETDDYAFIIRGPEKRGVLGHRLGFRVEWTNFLSTMKHTVKPPSLRNCYSLPNVCVTDTVTDSNGNAEMNPSQSVEQLSHALAGLDGVESASTSKRKRGRQELSRAKGSEGSSQEGQQMKRTFHL